MRPGPYRRLAAHPDGQIANRDCPLLLTHAASLIAQPSPAGRGCPASLPRIRCKVLIVVVTAVVALGLAGSALAVNADRTGAWDEAYAYSVKGKERTCVLTRKAKCKGAKLRGRVIHHGDLRKANLRKADLRFADFRGANLKRDNLRGANLDGVRWAQTVCPNATEINGAGSLTSTPC